MYRSSVSETGCMEIDAVIDRFLALLRRLGLDEPQPSDPAVLAEVEQALAPLRLPAEARRLVERVDLATVRLQVFPGFQGLALSVELWRQLIELGRAIPRPLFGLCCESHVFLLVELDDPHGQGGGALFEWANDDPSVQHTLRHYSVADWLDTIIAVADGGGVTPGRDGTWAWLDQDHYEQMRSERLAASPPHPVYGRPALHPRYPHLGYGIFLGPDVRDWPAHWRSLSGFDDDVLAPRGATHTVAALLAEAEREDQARGTIVGEVVSIAGSDRGVTALVDDGTGTLPIWSSADVAKLGPSLRRRFEFDVVLGHDAPAPEGQVDRPDPIAARFLGALGPTQDAAIAEAVRPLHD
jgi:hypothetical protein